jgi:hypothetical protein
MTAHCVILRLAGGMPVCHVHEHPVDPGQPCPGNGQPADGTAVHDCDRWGRVRAAADWATATDRQRPLVIHRGDLRSERPAHETDGVLCWCRPEVIPAATP